MALGILECKKMEMVPGTSLMTDGQYGLSQEDEATVLRLKHGKGRFRDIILVPQPTDHPDDPLNWSIWKKDALLLIVSLTAGVVGAYGPMLSPGFGVMAVEMGVEVADLAQATSWLTLAIGLSLFLLNPLAKLYGKRPVYILSVCIMFSCSVWGAFTKDYNSYLASRALAGVGMAPFEVLVQCTIGDLYFVHERATRIAVWNLFLLTGVSGGSLISGYIIQYIGYHWTFGICAIMFGILVFAIILFVPETSYRRPLPDQHQASTDVSISKDIGVAILTNLNLDKQEKMPHELATSISSYTRNNQEQRQTYLQSLRVYTGRHSDAPIYKIFARPIVLFFYPPIIWGFLLFGVTFTWIVIFSILSSALFGGAPYNFSPSQIGLLQVSPFILTLLGEAVSGPLSDKICVYLTKRNRGVFEPEFRLVLILPVAIIGAVGYFGFGASMHNKTNWIGPAITLGLANMSFAMSSTVVFGYILDSFPTLNEEAFVAINAANFFKFGMTYFVSDWFAKNGVLNMFNVIGSVFLVSCILTMPLWIYGKTIRSWIARNKWLNEFMNDA